MSELDAIVARARDIFEDVELALVASETSTSRRVRLEVVAPATAADTPTLLVVTPWSITALAFPPDARFPAWLDVDGTRYAVRAGELAGLGPFRSVTFAAGGAHLPSSAHARKVARSLAEPFRAAVARARSDGAAPRAERTRAP